MSVPKATYSLQGIFLKSTESDRQTITDVFSNIGVNSDLVLETNLVANTPVTVVLTAVPVLQFLFIRVMDGPCTVTITPQGGSPVAIPVNDFLWIGDTAITGLALSSTTGCRVTVYGGSA